MGFRRFTLLGNGLVHDITGLDITESHDYLIMEKWHFRQAEQALLD